MINGKVTTNLEATIDIEVSGPNPTPQQTEAVVDTGFNGYLTLPSQLVSLLNLPLAGGRYANLAMVALFT